MYNQGTNKKEKINEYLENSLRRIKKMLLVLLVRNNSTKKILGNE